MVVRNTSCETCSDDNEPKMTFLKIVLFLCLATGQRERTLAAINECVGPPPIYSNSTFDKCVENQATGSCNCTAPAQTCRQGDQLYYKCDHGTDLDFVIVCDYKDGQGNFGFIIWQNSTEKFEACTGSPAPVKSTPPPQPTFPPSQCSQFNVATLPPEGCIRLVGNQTKPDETTGILQVYFNTTWGSVCLTGHWTDEVVNIACRMLGFNSHGSPSKQPSPIYNLPPGLSNDAWSVNIRHSHSCSGTEDTLWDCDRTDACWLTHALGGSGECPSLLNISCKESTAFPDLTSCPPLTTTTPNPTTLNPTTPVPAVSTHHTEVPDSITQQERTTSSGQESSSNAGPSTAAIVGIMVAGVVGVGVVFLFGREVYKRCKERGSKESGGNAATGTHLKTQPGQSKTPARADNNPPAEEHHDSMEDTEEKPTESHNDHSAGEEPGVRMDSAKAPQEKISQQQLTTVDC